MRDVVYRGRIVTLEIEDGVWEIARHDDAVAVLAIDPQGRVLGVRQRRRAVERETWELPAGLIDAGEPPEAAAARELAEEARLAGTLTPLTRMYVSPGFTDELVHLFVATDLRPDASHSLDDGEEVEVEWRDPLEVWHEVASGALATSGVTLLGIRHALAARRPDPLLAPGDAPRAASGHDPLPGSR
jgi:ADP-ribose pyrophosphatase